MEWIDRYVLGGLIPLALMGVGLYFCLRLRMFHLLRPRAMLRALTRRQRGDGVSPLRALSLALAGTLGVGNIVGVSAAISLGGFGSILWMWVSALCAMLLKYAEIVLGLRHRRYDGAGKPHGGAMYYLRDCFAARGRPVTGRVLAAVFALLCAVTALTMGSVIQVNAITEALEGTFSWPPLLVGGVLALVCLLVIRQGTEGVLSLTGRLVPLMTVGYLVLSAAVLILRAERIPEAFLSIVRDALSPNAAAGGIGGFFLSAALRHGTMRGLISNEAGCGTAPAAHAVSGCDCPAEQGVWGILEVFADTVVLCTVTALVVIVTWPEVVARDGEFMLMTLTAYSSVLGAPAAVFMSVAVLLFGFATVICWAHYGMESVTYLWDRPVARGGFVLLYTASVAVGGLVSAPWIWQTTDLAVGAMTLINLVALCLMRGEVIEETERWLRRKRRFRS